MDLSPAHAAARAEAARVPALGASLNLLDAAPGPAAIEIYGTARPAPGGPPGGAPLVVLSLASPAGTLDATKARIVLTAPITAQITGADPTAGTDAVWARIVDGAGAWWADASVSDTAGDGEIQLGMLRMLNGAMARVTSAVLNG